MISIVRKFNDLTSKQKAEKAKKVSKFKIKHKPGEVTQVNGRLTHVVGRSDDNEPGRIHEAKRLQAAHTKRSMTNGKPYRTKELKESARATAKKDKDGAIRSNAPILRHSPAKE